MAPTYKVGRSSNYAHAPIGQSSSMEFGRFRPTIGCSTTPWCSSHTTLPTAYNGGFGLSYSGGWAICFAASMQTVYCYRPCAIRSHTHTHSSRLFPKPPWTQVSPCNGSQKTLGTQKCWQTDSRATSRGRNARAQWWCQCAIWQPP